MIQRIQTLYWTVAILLVVLVFLVSDVMVYQLEGEKFSIKSGVMFIFFSITFILSVLLAIINFKKVKKQLQLAKISLVINGLLIIYLLTIRFFGHKILFFNSLTLKTEIGFYLILITFPLSFLAYSGVKRDKSLLDSLDRLR